jgi:hypothetical protein
MNCATKKVWKETLAFNGGNGYRAFVVKQTVGLRRFVATQSSVHYQRKLTVCFTFHGNYFVYFG